MPRHRGNIRELLPLAVLSLCTGFPSTADGKISVPAEEIGAFTSCLLGTVSRKYLCHRPPHMPPVDVNITRDPNLSTYYPHVRPLCGAVEDGGVTYFIGDSTT